MDRERSPRALFFAFAEKFHEWPFGLQHAGHDPVVAIRDSISIMPRKVLISRYISSCGDGGTDLDQKAEFSRQ
jgi:hypothetical protein